jgi:hypothetical protein
MSIYLPALVLLCLPQQTPSVSVDPEVFFPEIREGKPTREVRIGGIGLSSKGLEYSWAEEAYNVHAALESHEQVLKSLLESPEPQATAAALILLSPYIWQGPEWSLPERRIADPRALDLRRRYAPQVEELLRTTDDWDVKVGCLVYYTAFPERLKPELLVERFSLLEDWGHPERDLKKDANHHRFGQFIAARKKYQGSPLSYLAFWVYCNARPKEAITLGLDKLQEKERWLVPIVNTRAYRYLDSQALERIKAPVDRKLVGSALGSKVSKLAYYYSSYCNAGGIDHEECWFPETALRAALADSVAAQALREVLTEKTYWLSEAGVEVNWKRAKPSAIVAALNGLYEKQKRAALEAEKKESGKDR